MICYFFKKRAITGLFFVYFRLFKLTLYTMCMGFEPGWQDVSRMFLYFYIFVVG